MACFVFLAEGIANADDSLRFAYVSGVKCTTYLAFGLMALQSAFVDILETDRNNAIAAGMIPDGGASAEASAYNMQYQLDSQRKDTQCGQWETLVQSDQTQITNTSDERKANFSLANGMAAACAVLNSIIEGFRG